MLDGAAAVALGAGMLAALNPCGFALLPAYLMLLVTGDQPNRLVAVLRAMRMTAAMTAGFLLVFAAFGLVVAPLASSVQRYLPWVTVVVGVLLLGGGLWLLAGRAIPGPKRRAGGGAAVAGALLFLLYAAGMGLVVGTAALAVALAQQSLVRRARRLGRLVPAAGGVLLAMVGAYVAYYGWWEIRVLGGGPVDDPVIEAAATMQRSLATAVASMGATGFLLAAVGLAALSGLAAVVRRRMRRTGKGTATPWSTAKPTSEV